jgi:hypothetical protein
VGLVAEGRGGGGWVGGWVGCGLSGLPLPDTSPKPCPPTHPPTSAPTRGMDGPAMEHRAPRVAWGSCIQDRSWAHVPPHATWHTTKAASILSLLLPKSREPSARGNGVAPNACAGAHGEVECMGL